MKIAVFAGTFDPFTVGHADVVEKCKKIFDKTVDKGQGHADGNHGSGDTDCPQRTFAPRWFL